MKKTIKKILTVALLTMPFMASSQVTNNPVYWADDPVSEIGVAPTYTSAMHTRFADLTANYEEGGIYYYSDTTNTFGYLEVLNTEQEMLFCTGSEVNFTTAYKLAAEAGLITGDTVKIDESKWAPGAGDFKVDDDSSTMGFSPSEFDVEVRAALENNSATKGRFCYDMTDYANRVDYRNAAAAVATYCSSGLGGVSFNDDVSGYSCELDLDVDLKVGETRYLRQLQSTSVTIGQGFLGCYKNPTTGIPELELISNPSTCTPSSRSTCNYSCDWADDVVCASVNMPRWGGDKCGGLGTTIFKDEAISVSSSDGLSYDTDAGVLYQGSASMRCAMVGTTAQWIVTSQNCSPTTN
jgi:hypothetical protein